MKYWIGLSGCQRKLYQSVGMRNSWDRRRSCTNTLFSRQFLTLPTPTSYKWTPSHEIRSTLVLGFEINGSAVIYIIHRTAMLLIYIHRLPSELILQSSNLSKILRIPNLFKNSRSFLIRKISRPIISLSIQPFQSLTRYKRSWTNSLRKSSKFPRRSREKRFSFLSFLPLAIQS
jgi:hypothetical protein